MAISCSANLFGPRSQYIKTNGGDIIAVDGANTRERLILSDLRIPYKQILKSRVYLRVGQANYLLNHLGLGDNATFLAIKAVYDTKSVNEADNYICWSYADDLTRVNYFADMMVLTGNSTHRIPQLYLTNPNTNYTVSLDVMVAIIDDTYSIFTDTLNQSGYSFIDLEFTDIHTHVVGESIVINDKSSPVKPLVYIILTNINSIDSSGQILIIDDSSRGSIFLQFLTEYDAYQALSLLNYVLEHPSVNIDTITPRADTVSPVIYFYSNVGNTASSDYIAFNGATAGVPYDTSYGNTFSTSISLTTYGQGTYSSIDKSSLIDLLIDYIEDNRDGEMSIMASNLLLYNATASSVDLISTTGTYSLMFDYSDIARNNLSGVTMTLSITS